MSKLFRFFLAKSRAKWLQFKNHEWAQINPNSCPLVSIRGFWSLSAPILAGFWLCGCQSYQYRIVQPPTSAVVVKAPVTVDVDPLQYQFSQYRDRLAVNVTNPTDDQIALLGGRSFVIDPQNESHPLRDRIIGPHSFTRILLPPIPFTYSYPDYWAWGPRWAWWGPGMYDPFWYGPGFYGPPPIAYGQVVTVFDWEWKTGMVRLRLTYDRNGKTFEHNFEILREPEHK